MANGKSNNNENNNNSNDNEDDGGLLGGMFGDDDEEETPTALAIAHDGQQPSRLDSGQPMTTTTSVPLAHADSPVPDPRGMLVVVRYAPSINNGNNNNTDDDRCNDAPAMTPTESWHGAKIVKFEPDSDTYIISWLESGVLQYRTALGDIRWERPNEAEIPKAQIGGPAPVQDELWLAARRGSLNSVKRFVDSGVDFNETGTSQERTPFYHAVLAGHLDCVEYFLALGATDPDGTAFIVAGKVGFTLFCASAIHVAPNRSRDTLFSKLFLTVSCVWFKK